MPGRNTEPKEKTDDLQGQAVRPLALPDNVEALQLEACISQNRTALCANGGIEGGFSAKFDIPETCSEQFKELADWRNDSFTLVLLRKRCRSS